MFSVLLFIFNYLLHTRKEERNVKVIGNKELKIMLPELFKNTSRQIINEPTEKQSFHIFCQIKTVLLKLKKKILTVEKCLFYLHKKYFSYVTF